MPKRFYKAQLGFISALSTDVQTPSDNVAMKLTNTNPKKCRIIIEVEND